MSEEKFSEMEIILKKLLSKSGYVVDEFDTSLRNSEEIAKHLFQSVMLVK
jgi:hypothetical protein